MLPENAPGDDRRGASSGVSRACRDCPGKSSGVGRECELLGKDKEVDMWVRNSDVPIGILQSITGDAGRLLDELDEPPKELPPKGK
jgi:hypothetical protein